MQAALITLAVALLGCAGDNWRPAVGPQAWQTSQGVMVTGDVVPRAKVDRAIQDAVSWWTSREPEKAARVWSYVRQGTLRVVVSAGPLEGPAREVTYGNDVFAWWPSPGAEALYLRGHEGRAVEDLFLATVRHGFGVHVAQTGMGRHGGDYQHLIAHQLGCPDR